MQQSRVRTLNEDEELMQELKQKPRFVAQHVTRELVMNGRLPMLEQYGDHLARYGKGFSQMLSLAGEQRQDSYQTLSPRLMPGLSSGQLTNAETRERSKEK